MIMHNAVDQEQGRGIGTILGLRRRKIQSRYQGAPRISAAPQV